MKVAPTARATNSALAQEFVKFAIEAGALRFGDFKTKAGRDSPYFFDAGVFSDGVKLGRLSQFYGQCLQASLVDFDVLFGPAYKGIALAAAVAVELSRQGNNVRYAYNRKEVKDHGEGGSLVGSVLSSRVLIVDDVMSAGTSVSESVRLIEAAGGQACGVAVALDRQERAVEHNQEMACSAVNFVEQKLCLNVAAIARLDDLLQYLQSSEDPAMSAHYERVSGYRERYGV